MDIANMVSQVAIINSTLLNVTHCYVEAEIISLSSIDPTKSVEGYLVKEVTMTLGERTYKWDLHVATVVRMYRKFRPQSC